MDQIWKWIMHMNAKVFCLAAFFLFFGIAAWCGFEYMTPAVPFKDGGGKLPELVSAWEIGTLTIVSNQLASESLAIPVDPFRPTIEAIFTNETERAAFLKALKAAQAAAAGVTAPADGSKKEDPFAHLRKKDKNATPGTLTGPDGRPMVVPKLTFLGFFQRPDGKQAAMFHDSVANTTLFYDAGKQAVHGVEILDADVRDASIRFPDGSTRKLAIGGNVELAAEVDTRPPVKKAIPAKAGAAAAAKQAKAGQQKIAQQQKPGAQKAGLQKKPSNRRPHRKKSRNKPSNPALTRNTIYVF